MNLNEAYLIYLTFEATNKKLFNTMKDNHVILPTNKKK